MKVQVVFSGDHQELVSENDEDTEDLLTDLAEPK